MSVLEVFLVLVFPYSDYIRRDTEYRPVFSPNAGKYGPEKTSNTDTIYAVAGLFLNLLKAINQKFSEVSRRYRKIPVK